MTPIHAPKLRALAALLNVPWRCITCDDPGGKVFAFGKTEYTVLTWEINNPGFVPVGKSGEYWCYRIR